MNLFAQAQPSFWNGENGSTGLLLKIVIALLLGFGLIFALLQAPTRLRRPIVVTVTFFCGLYYVLSFFWPAASDAAIADPNHGPVVGVSEWLKESLPVIQRISNVLTAFLLGLGIYSLLSVHGKRLIRRQRDWQFSLLLLGSMFTMTIFGYLDWLIAIGPNAETFAANPGFVNRTKDLLFDGLLQQMDAAMFSIIAFFIFSAAYRAFRIRSIESTILLSTALIVMLSFMGVIVVASTNLINGMANGDTGSVLMSFKLSSIQQWLRDTIQTPAIRGVDFGIGIGALAMGLRLWLSLERGGISG